MNWPCKILLLLIILILIPSCSAQPKTRFDLPVGICNLHKTIYLEDGFSQWQQQTILSAIDDWECATNDIIQFKVKFHATEEDELFTAGERYSLIIRNTTSNNSKIKNSNSKRTDGDKTIGLYTRDYYGTPMILLVDDRLDQYMYKGTVLHELGHALGLEHVNNYDSIMYPDINLGPRVITNADLKKFCKIYSCNYNKFKPCFVTNN